MRCEFCGREMSMRTVFGGLRIPEPCTCEGATAHYSEEDRRQREEEFDRVMRQSVANARIPPKFRIYPEYGAVWSIYIHGEQGRGKTERACGVLRRWLKEGIAETSHNTFVQTRSARFVSVPEWLMEMRRTYDVRGQSESDVMGAYAGTGLLCLDDLGKGQMTEWALERIYTLISLRYNNERPIVVTSQYSLEQLTDRLTERGDAGTASAITSRLAEMCKVGMVRGRDWRTDRRQ